MEPAKRVIHHVGVSQRGTIMSALAPSGNASATCFEQYVRTAQFVPFMRDVLRVIEEERSDKLSGGCGCILILFMLTKMYIPIIYIYVDSYSLLCMAIVHYMSDLDCLARKSCS